MESNKRMYIDIHVIQTIPPSCMNRDDTGSPKTCTYGGTNRSRVSSQSWKRAVREYFKGTVDEGELGTRTKRIVELVANEIVRQDPSIPEAKAQEMSADVLSVAGIQIAKEKKKGKGKGDDDDQIPEAKALFFMSRKQTENVAALAIAGDYDKKKAQAALNAGNGIDIALFGRMVADDPSMNADASAQVAHAISTHSVVNEYDYYTAVDEMSPADNAGAGMIGTVEFNSSTMYRYATVAVHDLKRQLSDDATVTAMAVREFIRAFILSMPTGKMNTFANRTVPEYVLIEMRDDQPVNCAAAFESPVQPGRDRGGYSENSVRALESYVSSIRSFVPPAIGEWRISGGVDSDADTVSLQTALDQIVSAISEEQ